MCTKSARSLQSSCIPLILPLQRSNTVQDPTQPDTSPHPTLVLTSLSPRLAKMRRGDYGRNSSNASGPPAYTSYAASEPWSGHQSEIPSSSSTIRPSPTVLTEVETGLRKKNLRFEIDPSSSRPTTVTICTTIHKGLKDAWWDTPKFLIAPDFSATVTCDSRQSLQESGYVAADSAMRVKTTLEGNALTASRKTPFQLLRRSAIKAARRGMYKKMPAEVYTGETSQYYPPGSFVEAEPVTTATPSEKSDMTARDMASTVTVGAVSAISDFRSQWTGAQGSSRLDYQTLSDRNDTAHNFFKTLHEAGNLNNLRNTLGWVDRTASQVSATRSRSNTINPSGASRHW